MLEMKIASGYLRKIEPGQIDQEHDPPLLTAVESDDGQQNLGLEFYLRKPKLALIIESGGTDLTLDEHRLRSNGVDIVPTFDEAINTGADHEFLILVNPTAEELQVATERRAACQPASYGAADSSQSTLGGWLARTCSTFGSPRLEVVREYLWKASITSAGLELTKFTVKNGRQTLSAGAEHTSCIFSIITEPLRQAANPEELFYYEPYETRSPTGFVLNNYSHDGRWQSTIIMSWSKQQVSKSQSLMSAFSASRRRIVESIRVSRDVASKKY